MRDARFQFAVLVATLAAACACAPAALAAQSPVIVDCSANHRLTHTYTVTELQHALASLSPTELEYTNCGDVINRALASGSVVKPGGGGGPGNSSGGSFLPTPLIVVLGVLILAAGWYAALALRRRPGSGSGSDAG